jgi:hypothetical protein
VIMEDRRPGRRADRKPASWNRIAIWVITSAVGAYLVLTGVIGILDKG